MRRFFIALVGAIFCASTALGQPLPPQTVSPYGTATKNAVNVQVDPAHPLAVSATVNVAGAADLPGNTATFNAANVCTAVLTAGEQSVGFHLDAGTLAATLSAYGTQATGAVNCASAGTCTSINFSSGASIVVTNPNGVKDVGVIALPGMRQIEVCTSAYTSGSATGVVTATYLNATSSGGGGGTVNQGTGAAANAPWSAELTDGSSFYTAAKTGQLPTALDGSGFLKTHEQGTATVSGTVTAAQATAANLNAQVQGAAASGAAKAGSPVQIGGVFNTTQPTVTTGQAVEAQATARGAQIVSTGVDTFHVTVDSAPTTTVTGTVTTTPPSNASTNVAQVNGVTTQTGAGTAGTGTQRVAVADSDGVVLATANSGRLQVDVVTGGGSNASVGATASAVPSSATYLGGNKSGNLTGVSLDSSGNLNVNVAAGGASGGTSSSFGGAFPATGTAAGASDGTNMQALQVESSSNKNLRAGIYNGGTEAAVKAASTAAGATDPALVVAVSPNNSVAVTGSVTANIGTSGSLALDATVAKLNNAQGSTTSGETGPLAQGAVTTSAPSYTTAQTSPLSLDTSGNLRVVFGGTQNVQGLGSSDGSAPSGGSLTVTGNNNAVAIPVQTTGSTVLAANAANRTVAATTLSTNCTTTTSCAGTAAIVLDVTGAQSAMFVITAISTPVGITPTCDMLYDGATTALNASCNITNGSTGAFKGTALANSDIAAGTWWRVSWDGAPTRIRIRNNALTSGTYTIAAAAVMAPGVPPFVSTAVAGGLSKDVSGNPLGLPEMVQAHTTVPSSTADGDPAIAAGDHLGRTVVVANADRALEIDGVATPTTTTQTTILAAVASTFLDVTAFSCENLTSTATTVTWKDNTTVRYTMQCPAALGPCSGFALQMPMAQAAVNTNWSVTLGTAVGGSGVACFAQAVKNK